MASHNRFLVFILGAIVLGAFLGGWFPHAASYVGFLGDIFLNALRMIVVPLVVASIVVGVANLGDVRRLGGMGKRTILYYLITTGLSVAVGLVLVNVIQPGAGVQHGEDLPSATYVVDHNRVELVEAQFQHTHYDGRYVILLVDQELVGALDEEHPPGPGRVTVVDWRSRATGQTAEPRPRGVGLRVDLGVAERVRSKDQPIFEVLVDVLLGMVPTNIAKAMVETDVLPLIVFSVLFGGVLTTLGARGRPVIQVFDGVNQAIMKIVHIVIAFAPLGILGLIAARMAGSGGWSGFLPELYRLGWYAVAVIAGLLIHALITLPLVLILVGRRRGGPYARNMFPALSTAFSTASSSATLPVTIECVEEENKISPRVSSFVLPLGATINMDGTALYEAVAAIFIAQVYGIDLGPVAQVVIFLTATLAAIGAAGIPEAGLVTMVIVLRAVGLPIEGISLLLIIDWFLDRCRTTVNVWGDAVGAAVVARYEEEDPVSAGPPAAPEAGQAA